MSYSYSKFSYSKFHLKTQIVHFRSCYLLCSTFLHIFRVPLPKSQSGQTTFLFIQIVLLSFSLVAHVRCMLNPNLSRLLKFHTERLAHVWRMFYKFYSSRTTSIDCVHMSPPSVMQPYFIYLGRISTWRVLLILHSCSASPLLFIAHPLLSSEPHPRQIIHFACCHFPDPSYCVAHV